MGSEYAAIMCHDIMFVEKDLDGDANVWTALFMILVIKCWSDARLMGKLY